MYPATKQTLLIASWLCALVSTTVSATLSGWEIAWLGVEEARQKQYTAVNAAEELSGYIRKATGNEISVRPFREITARKNIFLITEEKYAPEDIRQKLAGKARDAFVIKYPYYIDDKEVCILVSRDSHGYDFPVYYFLTRFMGVNWVGPGELGEVFTFDPAWRMPPKIDILENPDFQHRWWGLPAFSCRKWLGASPRMTWHHALGRVFDPRKYGKSNPEVYPLLSDGTRFVPSLGKERGYSRTSGWQPCTSNSKSIEIATEHVLNFLNNNPHMLSASLSINDGAGNVCMCEDCRALDEPDSFDKGRHAYLSDRFFAFYNKVIENVLKKNPDAYIAVFSYGVTKMPPRRVKIHPRILVFHVSPRPETIVEWREQTGAVGNIHYWLWDAGFLIIRPNMRIVAELIRTAKHTGATGFYTEDSAFWPSSGPRFYVLSNILWNTRKDVDELYNEYCALAYGKAAGQYVREYYRRWDEIFNRNDKKLQYDIMETWRKLAQFDELRRNDLEFMDSMLAQAAEARKTGKETQRLDYLLKYHRWLAINAKQFVLSRELTDQKWLASISLDQLGKLTTENSGLTNEFNKIWNEEIATDNSGWLLDLKKSPSNQTWNRHYERLRNLVATEYECALEKAFETKINAMLRTTTRTETVKLLEDKIKRTPALAMYIKPEINRINGIVPTNIVRNGGFEEGKAGNPPHLAHWKTYQEYGMMQGTRNNYKWEPGTGKVGDYALGLGDGDYAEIRSHVRLDTNGRYRVSFWYKTENSPEKSEFQIFRYTDDRQIADIAALDIKYFVSFLPLNLPDTMNEWRYYTCTFTTKEVGNYIINIDAGRQKPGQWLWLDDIKIVKLY